MKDPDKRRQDLISTALSDSLAMIVQLRSDVAILKKALRIAIVDRARVNKRTVEVDPAGNVYEYDWLPRVREWARLCDLDLDKVDPVNDGDFYS